MEGNRRGNASKQNSNKRARTQVESDSSSGSESETETTSPATPARPTLALSLPPNSPFLENGTHTPLAMMHSVFPTTSLNNFSFPDEEAPIIPTSVDPSFNLAAVGGLEEQVHYVRKNILYALRNKDAFEKWGMEPMKGVIFHGPPGTGKTLLAKALCTELSTGPDPANKVTFFMQKGGECFSKWIGASEKTLRNLFREAAARKPAIIFLDELDGLCPARTSESHQFYSSIVTTLLGLIDEIKRGEVFLIGATNRLESIDPAIRRPGRFDKALAFYPPNEGARRQILEIAVSNWRADRPSLELIAHLAHSTVGFTGADLKQLCRDAFNCAMDRTIENSSGENNNMPDLSSMKILEVDWSAALAGMGKSNSNVFGNSIYTGGLAHPSILPLISGIVRDISARINNLIQTEKCNDLTLAHTGIRSLLVWGDSVQTVKAIGLYIFPAFMASLDVEKTPGFLLSEETLLKVPVTTVLEQVATCRKTCYLFIPRIDQLWGKLVQHGVQDLFISFFETTRTTNIVIVASSLRGLEKFPDDLKSRFAGVDRQFQARRPNDNERMEFFNPLLSLKSKFLSDLKASIPRNMVQNFEVRVKAMNARVQKMTKGDEILIILTLQGELLRAFTGDLKTGKKDYLLEVENVITAYEKDKMGSA